MYRNILKRDLKRKKTMNAILALFILLAVVFIASSVSNLTTILTAMDGYMEKAGFSDYETWTMSKDSVAKIESIVENSDTVKEYCYSTNPMVKNEMIKVNGKNVDCLNTICIGSPQNSTINFFDKDNQKIETIKNGEIYLTAVAMEMLDVKIGDTILIGNETYSKEFEVKGIVKDLLFGSPMVSVERLVMNDSELNELRDKLELTDLYGFAFQVSDMKSFEKQMNEIGINRLFTAKSELVYSMYMIDMVIAATLILVSICLVVLSVILLKFTISFTINEEFREIGVMKAIGIHSRKIRTLYVLKYFLISVVGGVIGFALSIPFGKLMLAQTSDNIVMDRGGNILINVLCSVLIVLLIIGESFRATGKIKKMKPIEAIRNGATGERFKGKGVISMRRISLKPVSFMAVNDITSKWKQFIIMILTFIAGILLVIMPANTANTLKSDELITWFAMVKSDVCMSKSIISDEESTREIYEAKLSEIKSVLQENGMKADVHQEVLFVMNAQYGENVCSSISFQGLGDIKTNQYIYLEGEAPQYANEVAISHIISDNLEAGIGDTIEVNIGDEKKEYLVTAIFQTMNNGGEGIRFHESEELDYSKTSGEFAVQIEFKDNPSEKEIEKRIQKIEKLFPEYSVQTSGDYINTMMGGIAEQVESVKWFIFILVMMVNILVVVLIEKSLLTKERGEIGMLKAIGFSNRAIIKWQTLRIGIVFAISTLIGVVLSTPFSQITSGNVFKMMGAVNIKFTINALEVFVIYPVILFVVTILTSGITALNVRKIQASEISSIE